MIQTTYAVDLGELSVWCHTRDASDGECALYRADIDVDLGDDDDIPVGYAVLLADREGWTLVGTGQTVPGYYA